MIPGRTEERHLQNESLKKGGFVRRLNSDQRKSPTENIVNQQEDFANTYKTALTEINEVSVPISGQLTQLDKGKYAAKIVRDSVIDKIILSLNQQQQSQNTFKDGTTKNGKPNDQTSK